MALTPVQLPNDFCPIFVMVAGMFNSVSDTQFWKVASQILCTLAGNSIDFSARQLSKA